MALASFDGWIMFLTTEYCSLRNVSNDSKYDLGLMEFVKYSLICSFSTYSSIELILCLLGFGC